MDLSDFNGDIISEILTRISLESLDVCKAVCKDWKDIIYEPNFTSNYCKRTKNFLGHYFQGVVPYTSVSQFVSSNQSSENDIDFTIDNLPENTKILASSKQGILCCLRRNKIRSKLSRYHICKPSTKQWQILPNPKTRYPTIQVGLIITRSTPLRYKIVRISEPSSSKYSAIHYWVEVFDSEMWEWKEPKALYLLHQRVIRTNTPVTACGSIYFMTNDYNLLAFDGDEESFSTIPLQQSVIYKAAEEYKDIQLVEYKGRLACIVQQSTQCLKLWVVEDLKNGTWKKEKTINIDYSINEKIEGGTLGLYNGDTAFMRSGNKVIVYRSHDRSYNEVKLNVLKCISQSFPFQSDREPINLKPV